MGKMIRIGMAVTLAILLLAGWHTYRAATVGDSPFSQIYIHGTPVCIYEQGEEILARVGKCPDTPGESGEAPLGTPPFHRSPRLELPPGHPPVDEGPLPENRRTIPI
ncbi:MAG: hypothetical protein HY896_06090 [Deltaproteobacteria bacterium]|nr:hypothetical protein [Deltaproteobacteria bacterium]